MTADEIVAPEVAGRSGRDGGARAGRHPRLRDGPHHQRPSADARGGHRPHRDIGGRRLCLTVSHSIAAHKELEEFLRGLTDVDELTGLLNRRGFFVKVDEMRRRARRGNRQVLLMYFDVDGLKRVNDERGHADGDKLLVAAADVLRAAFRERDVVARLGGDEFVAMALLGRRHDERLDRQAIEARLCDAVRAKRESSATTTTSRSASAPWWPTHGARAIDELLARADQAMYSVKRARRREPAGGAPAPGG